MAEKDTVQEAVSWYKENRHIYTELADVVENIIRSTFEKRNIVYHSIESRTKGIKSFKRKAKRDKYLDPINEITDLTGIRIITLFEKDVYEISNIIKELFSIDYAKSEDKSDLLEADKMGYKSVHYIAQLIERCADKNTYIKFKSLNFEIQIRSILQHAWAEIEHDRNYKFKGELPKKIQRRFYSLAGMLEMADREFNLLDKEVKDYKDKVKRLTQDGKLSLELNEESLKGYLGTEFSPELRSGCLRAEFGGSYQGIIGQLREYGVSSLVDLDNIIPDKFYKTLNKHCCSKNSMDFSELLSMLMIINDHRKYFENFWPEKNTGLNDNCAQIIKEYGVDLEKLIDEYKNR